MGQVTLGGDRLGSGKKEKVYLRDYERSTHDLGYSWKSTMSAGTLVPFMCEVALPGDTHEINLEADVLTHPTIGPLFGSYKVQLDVFTIPMRLYNSELHMNMLNIGLKMETIHIPQYELLGKTPEWGDDLDNYQVNPSSIFSYLGVRGLGGTTTKYNNVHRYFNAVPWLAYWDIYKNYYANKSEEIGYVIHNNLKPYQWDINYVMWNNGSSNSTWVQLDDINDNNPTLVWYRPTKSKMRIFVSGNWLDGDEESIYLYFGANGEREIKITEIFDEFEYNGIDGFVECRYARNIFNAGDNELNLSYGINQEITFEYLRPKLQKFDLSDIDDMRFKILRHDGNTGPFTINYNNGNPKLYDYGIKYKIEDDKVIASCRSNQEGLGIKTYQSDLYNNWLDKEWIDGNQNGGGINNITKVSITDDSFTINELLMAKKVYDMLNRIAVSGGSYDDWLDATYTQERIKSVENPIYMGGLSKELVFQEVIATAGNNEEPLGTLAGRGRLNQKKKGGYVKIKTDEPSYILGIISLTPRICYSQGNKFDVDLKTMNDLHKPQLDEIGFQNLMSDNMAAWSSIGDVATGFNSVAVGKQPAWINYMTNVDVVKGNFAIANQQMYMVLNRKYDVYYDVDGRPKIKDLTTYIDPSKFNHIFADTRLDAQNFWVQVDCNITARRKMSAKIIPNL
jgi:hypothetical protein